MLPLAAIILALSPTADVQPIDEPPMVRDELAYLDRFQERLEQVARHDRMVGFAAALIENGEVVATFTSGETALVPRRFGHQDLYGHADRPA